MTGPISWPAQREKDTDFQGQEPDVVIVGGGHKSVIRRFLGFHSADSHIADL